MRMDLKFDLCNNKIVKKIPTLSDGRYRIFCLENATGVLYVTNDSPQYISGHLRLRGKDKGQYPYKYKELINELFGEIGKHDIAIEVCSGDVRPEPQLMTVDINFSKSANLVCDGQAIEEPDAKYSRWYCDPPYTLEKSMKMYQTPLPSFSKLLTEGARLTKGGSLLFFLLGNVNMQWKPAKLTRIGLIFITIVPNQEVRALHIYYNHGSIADEYNVVYAK